MKAMRRKLYKAGDKMTGNITSSPIMSSRSNSSLLDSLVSLHDEAPKIHKVTLSHSLYTLLYYHT